jgi:GTP-binding protein Era
MDEPRAKAAHRAGAVALLGPPNAGKSTLLNAILGEKLAIVTAKPQTTRSRILGIHNRTDSQILFYDTPGLHRSARPLNRALNESVVEAAEGCDVGVLLVDLTRGWEEAHQQLSDQLREQKTPFLVVGTKADLPAAKGGSWPPPGAGGAVAVLRLSARSGRGVKALLSRLVEALPESPPLYPDDELTDRPVRWLAAELVREALFEELEQELPYAIAVEVVSFDESRADLVRIRANLLVERNSQKRIVVGTAGQVIKRIGVRARREIEALLGMQVHLELWVKIEPRWLKSPKRIKALGYM